jgi:hypothetical protein
VVLLRPGDQPLNRGIQCFYVDGLDQVFQKPGCLALRKIDIGTESTDRDSA